MAAAILFAPVPWPCPLRILAGIPCPTCGMTRAARFAVRGDLAAATRMHPLWFVVLPALAALVVGEAAGFVRVGRWGVALENRSVHWTGVAIGIAVVGVWVARFAGAFGGPAP